MMTFKKDTKLILQDIQHVCEH